MSDWWYRFFGNHQGKSDEQVRLVSPELSRTRPSLPLPAVPVTRNPREWEQVWKELQDGADFLDLTYVRLSIRLPNFERTYIYETGDPATHIGPTDWETSATLFVGGQAIGKMSFAGWRDGTELEIRFAQLASLTDHIETIIHRFSTSVPQAA